MKSMRRNLTNLRQARSQLSSLENVIYKALTRAGISEQEFVLIDNEAKKHNKLKESIRMMEKQRSDIKEIKLSNLIARK